MDEDLKVRLWFSDLSIQKKESHRLSVYIRVKTRIIKKDQQPRIQKEENLI